MLRGFEEKLEQVQKARRKAWEPVRNLEKEIKTSKSQGSELDSLLDFMSAGDSEKKNAHMQNSEQKMQELKSNHPIRGTDIIDTALKRWKEDVDFASDMFDSLLHVMRANKNMQMRQQAAVALVAVCERKIRLSDSYEQNTLYMEYVSEAFELLTKGNDNDIYYAQWGKILYDGGVCVSNAKKNDRLSACRKAYGKFQKVSKKIAGIEEFMDFVPNHENVEVELVILRNTSNSSYEEQKNRILRLLEDKTDSNRLLIRKYRFHVLKNTMESLGKHGHDITYLLEEIMAASKSFDGDVNALISDYKKVYVDAQKNASKTVVLNYVKDKKYLQSIPAMYKSISTTAYEDKLSYYLQSVAAYSTMKAMRDADCHEATKEFIAKNEAFFEEVLEKHIKKNAVDKLREGFRARTKIIPTQYLPLYSHKRTSGEKVWAYTIDLERSGITPGVEKELEALAWKNRWSEIPDSIVDKYYKKAEREYKKQAPRDEIDTSIQTPAWVGGFFGKLKKVGGFILAAWMGISVLAFVISGVSSLFGEKDLEKMTDDEIWEYMEEAMEDYDAELSATAAPASDFSYERGYVGDTIRITKYNGTAEVVEVPAVINGKNVTCIDGNAFENNMYLKKVIMPDTICIIHGGAFANCTLLEEVVFSKNTSVIMGAVFYNCTSLKQISLKSDKSSLYGINGNAFEGCTALEKVTIESDIFTNVNIGDSAFAGCSSLVEVSINGKRLEKVNLGNGTFNGASSLTKVSFADKIGTIGNAVFANCTSLTDIYLANAEIIAESAFENCTSLTSFKVSPTVKCIAAYAFRGCTSLSDIEIEPATLAAEEAGYQILDGAFSNTAIQEIEIPGNYDFLRTEIFAGCKSLEKVVWHKSGKNSPNQVSFYHAFAGAENLKELYLSRTVKEIQETDVPKSCTIYAAEGSVGHQYALNFNINWQPWTE